MGVCQEALAKCRKYTKAEVRGKAEWVKVALVGSAVLAGMGLDLGTQPIFVLIVERRCKMAVRTKTKNIHIFYKDNRFKPEKLHRSFSNLTDALAGIINRKIEFALVGDKKYNRKEFIKLCEGNK